MGDSFTHLHVHTEYSMLDGASRLDDVIHAAAVDGQPALGITDHGNMYGVLDFYRGCRDQGIKPIIGDVYKRQGVIDAPIGRSPRHPTRMAVSQQGRRAVTRYRVERRFDLPRPTALVTCELETGRTHQIRVHLRAIGHPVVGDRDYDGGRPGLDPGRPFLHAGRLRFDHPATGERIEVSAPLPDDLERCLAECS